MSSFAKSVVGEIRNSNRFRVQNFDTFTAHVVSQFAEASRSLWRWWIELFGYVNVAKIVLTAEVVDGKPFNFSDALVVGQLDGEVFVEVAL